MNRSKMAKWFAMSKKTLCLMCLGSLLTVADSASAGFIGIEVEAKDNGFGLIVCNVFAAFDGLGDDGVLAVFGEPGAPLDISVQNGTFYQDPYGGDTAPNAAFIPLFPQLAFDSFVTIGLKENAGGDAIGLTPGWPGFGAVTLPAPPDPGDNFGWFVTPGDSQSIAGPDNRVLIGQFSTSDGDGIAGTVNILTRENETFRSLSFQHPIPEPATLSLLAVTLLGLGIRRRHCA